MVEKFADYWNKDNVHIDRITYLPIVDATVRLANLKSGGLDLIERLARDRHRGGEGRHQAQAQCDAGPELLGHHDQCRQRRQGEEPARPARQGAPGARAVARSRGDQPGRVQRRVRAGQPVGQPGEFLLPAEPADPEARRRQGQGADQGGRRHAADRDRLHGAAGRREQGDRRGRAGDGGGGGLRHEDPRHRIRHLAEAGRAGRLSGLS